MAFANDLVLLTEERIHMQILIEASKEFLDGKGSKACWQMCESASGASAKEKVDESDNKISHAMRDREYSINHFEGSCKIPRS